MSPVQSAGIASQARKRPIVLVFLVDGHDILICCIEHGAYASALFELVDPEPSVGGLALMLDTCSTRRLVSSHMGVTSARQPQEQSQHGRRSFVQ